MKEKEPAEPANGDSSGSRLSRSAVALPSHCGGSVRRRK